MAKHVHLIGIGGIGMSALARYFKAAGWRVSGSDITESDITRALRKEGITVKIGHRISNLAKDAHLVIYNRAIPADNPELRTARTRKNLIVLPYATALGKLTERYQTVAVTGSHGKTTTTALAGLALMEGGLDPTIFIGTNLRELGGKNIRIGKSDYLVLEADDFGGAILEYFPTIAVVTNIDREHLDFYKTFGNLKKAFLVFLANTKHGGAFVLNRDDKNLYSLRNKINRIAKKKNIKIVWYSLRDKSSKKIEGVIKIPGEHNLSNAQAVYQLGKLLKISERSLLQAISSYKGAWRRMEYKGVFRAGTTDVKVYDDYAHHPTEIKATLKGFREKFPRSPLICVYQPHQAKRLLALFGEFKKAFDEADITLILPLYKVPGRDEIIVRDSAALVTAMKKRSPKKTIFYVPHPKNLTSVLKKILPPYFATRSRSRSGEPVLVMMGAGDIADLTKDLVKN